MSGADEIYELARDFGKASGKIASGLYTVFKESGEEFAKDWADNARETSGEHAARYPSSITSETLVSTDIVVVTGPEDDAHSQGFLGRILEFGGEHSPPHLDGARALPIAERRLDRGTDAAIGHLLP